VFPSGSIDISFAFRPLFRGTRPHTPCLRGRDCFFLSGDRVLPERQDPAQEPPVCLFFSWDGSPPTLPSEEETVPTPRPKGGTRALSSPTGQNF
jgi:hypothetical protein